MGILLGEFLVHGWDIARAVGRAWPISDRQAALVMEYLPAVLPGWVNPDRAAGLTAAFDVRVRGCARHLWSFTDGHLTVDPTPPQRPDVHVATAPVAFMLVCYRRLPQWRAIVAGHLVAWGRRPWLAPTLVGRFHAP